MNIDKDALSRYMPEIARICYEKHKDTLPTYSAEQLRQDIAEAKEYAKSPDRYEWGSGFKNYRLLYPEHIEKEVAFKQEELQDLWDRQDFDTYRDMYCEKLLRLANYNAQRLMIDDDEHFTLKNRNVFFHTIVCDDVFCFPFIPSESIRNSFILRILLDKIGNWNDDSINYKLLEISTVIALRWNSFCISDLYSIENSKLDIYACNIFFKYCPDNFEQRLKKIVDDGGNADNWFVDSKDRVLANALTIVQYCFKFLDDVTVTRENIYSEFAEVNAYFDGTLELLTKK